MDEFTLHMLRLSRRPLWSQTPTLIKKTKLPSRPLWLIKEEELHEKFIKGGSGPGGQKINKTNSKVQLTHEPTGIVVTCQYSRSQEKNRAKAREILALKLEELENPESCRSQIIIKRKSLVKQKKTQKAKKKYAALQEKKQEPNEEEAPDADAKKVMGFDPFS